VGFFGQSRVFYAMARDGLLPPFFAKLHKVFKTPINGIIVVGVVASCLAAFLPITAIAELVNIGTLAAFIIVSASVLILRRTRPDIERPFRTPFLPWVPILGIISSLGLVIELPTVTQLRFLVWLAIGLIIYYYYGRKNSILTGKHGTGEEIIESAEEYR
jgi:APA family basic amino acid/polyamine antiporter